MNEPTRTLEEIIRKIDQGYDKIEINIYINRFVYNVKAYRVMNIIRLDIKRNGGLSS